MLTPEALRMLEALGRRWRHVRGPNHRVNRSKTVERALRRVWRDVRGDE